MRPLSTLAAATACAISLTPPATAQKVVPVGIKRSEQKSLPVHKRATFTQSLNNNITGAGYYADVAVGTPPQNLSLILDTGSSDIWLLSGDAGLCSSRKQQLTYGFCLATCKLQLYQGHGPENNLSFGHVEQSEGDTSRTGSTRGALRGFC
jgi:hypothetical protein